MTDYRKRREQALEMVTSSGTEALLVTNPVNVTYLTGFTGDDSFLFLSAGAQVILSDPRYETQIEEECPQLETFIRKRSELLLDVTCRELVKRKLESLAVESNSLTVAQFDQMQESMPAVRLNKSSGVVESLRMIKDTGEVKLLRQAIEIAERVFTCVRAQLSGEHTELQVAHEIERLTRLMGGSACSFKPIVAVGPRAALPHAVPGSQRIGSQAFVLIDWGATLAGYRSDLTRVLVTSKIPPKFAKVYDAVLAAQQAAIAAMKPGVLVSEIDRVARAVLKDAKMANRFNHGLGHGIGLDIHEAPRLAANSEQTLQPGMVVTVEPGVYYPGWGGVRIEDDVLITADGCELLSNLPRELADNRVELLDRNRNG